MTKDQRKDLFLKELSLLCVKHKIQIILANPDSIDLWDLHYEGQSAILGNGVINHLQNTGEQNEQACCTL